jgi:predicted XRE-type DNA-binding protein
MRYPSAKKLEEMDKKLKDVEGARALPKNATYVERIKYDLCKRIIAFIRVNRITQAELAGRLGLDPARVSEIVNYKIDKFTVDTLLIYNRELNPEFEIKFKPAM